MSSQNGSTVIFRDYKSIKDTENLSSRLHVVFNSQDKRNSGVCGTLNANTWSTTELMDNNWGVPLSLADRIHAVDEKGRFIVEHKYRGSKMKYLASFIGTHYKDVPDGSGGMIRNILRLLHDPRRGIIVYTRCHRVHPQQCDDDAERERAHFFAKAPPYNYTDLLEQSKFCLVPKGRQPNSYRFLETVIHGCIPVYISDVVDRFSYNFFLSSIIPWEKVSFYIHGFSIAHLETFLSSVSEAERLERKTLLQNVVNHILGNVDQIAHAFVNEIIDVLHKSDFLSGID
eukprot:CAMPEP_0179619608 /NCGR_PEP_ID=MMETSP0932-20121108/243_1 /TAXON_ID=548131 ORGANISM="Ostreococcus mediterraneus, Strain clade-D-RCC2596" /NCGR_SAMPLE_ID=MMETSP0932 /ASSEMBLY_ACC=CAM_ASM_000582 /LENGTH=285 /DNA_ID=CAMNT_0021488589 /DNA_START=994 /DNA_END=1851 /DNA_ORIENTATION=-